MGRTPAAISILFTWVVTLPLPASVEGETALDRYVAAPDPSYAYRVETTLPGDGYTAAVLRMTSQTWLSEKEVDHPVWEHWLTIVRPASIRSEKALLFITGGSRDRGAPRSVDPMLAAIAKATQSVVAEL